MENSLFRDFNAKFENILLENQISIGLTKEEKEALFLTIGSSLQKSLEFEIEGHSFSCDIEYKNESGRFRRSIKNFQSTDGKINPLKLGLARFFNPHYLSLSIYEVVDLIREKCNLHLKELGYPQVIPPKKSGVFK